MEIINYISYISVPLVIIIIVVFGIIEKKPVFDMFLEGAKEGGTLAIKLFPTLVGLFVAIGMLRESGVVDCIINLLDPIIKIFNIPKEIMPLAILRPISRKCIYCYRN